MKMAELLPLQVFPFFLKYQTVLHMMFFLYFQLLEAQARYHQKALEEIEKIIPKMRETLSCNPTKPVYGISLEEHLRVTNRDIAQVLEACICFLLETGLDEEVIICSIHCLVWAFNTY